MSDLYFEILSGDLLARVKRHIEDRKLLDQRNAALLKEMGVEQYWRDLMSGTIAGVCFPNGRADFTKAKANGYCRPKRGTEWAKRFAEQVGAEDWRGFKLADDLGVPTSIRYHSDEVTGSACISGGFRSGVGFLYCSEGGPYALYIPDIAEKVARYEADGCTVDDACKNFKPEFAGCRAILKEEWDFVVAKHDMEEARRAKVAA